MTAQLNQLTTLCKKRKRVGRGGCRGGTAGRGNKGQNARSGGRVSPAFEGGQMPLHRRLPKRGFTNGRFKDNVDIVSIDILETIFNAGEIVTRELLVAKGVLKSRKSSLHSVRLQKIKILAGDNPLTKKLCVYADAFSAAAKNAIIMAGGEACVNKGAE